MSEKDNALTIMYMLPELNIGGVETHISALADGMTSFGHRVIIVSNGGAMVPRLEKSGIEHITLPVHRKSPVTIRDMASRIKKLVRDRGVDVVHAHSRVPAWIAHFGLKRMDTAFIITAHGQYAPHYGSSVMAMGDRIICVSRGIMDHMEQKLRANPAKMNVVYNGIDIESAEKQLASARDPREVKKEIGFSEDAMVIGSIGRLTSTKGHSFFIEAFKKIKNNRPDVKGIIVGDGPMRKELQDRIDELGLNGELVLTGVRTDIYSIFRAMDVYVVASIFEGFPMGCLEAMASRVPIVATTVGGIPEMIENERTALLVEPRDTDSLSAGVEKLLADERLRARMADAAYGDVVGKFSERKMLQEMLGIYYETMRTKRGYFPPPNGVVNPQPPRVMITLPELQVGGVETHVIDLSSGLKDKGFDPVIVSFGGKLVGKLEKKGIDHIDLPVHVKSPVTMFSMVRKIRTIFRERSIEIVHAHSRVPAWIVYFALKTTRKKIPFLTTCHSTYGVHIGSRVMALSDRTVSVSEYVRQHMIDNFGMAPDKIGVVRNGIHPEVYDEENAKVLNKKYREELGIDMNAKVIGMVGSLTPRKGYIYFIRAAAEVLKKHGDCVFIAVGGGRQQQELEDLTKELGIEKNFKFLGVRQDVQTLLSCFDVFVLSTLSEGPAPYVILEAMCFKTPVIASRVAGIPETVIHGENGMLIEAMDHEALAGYITELVENPELADRIGNSGRQSVLGDYNVDTMVNNVIKQYYDMCV